MSENWPDLFRRLEEAGVRGDEVQRLLDQFLRLSEADPVGMERILVRFHRALNEWEDGVVGRSVAQSRRGLRLVTDEEPQP